jgi:hypothetical protein
MEHRLIDQAMEKLMLTPANERTPEQIQGVARFICNAAGTPIDSPASRLLDLTELHAAALTLGAGLDSPTVNTYLKLSKAEQPQLSTFIHYPALGDCAGLVLSGRGDSAASVMSNLRQKALEHCALVDE